MKKQNIILITNHQNGNQAIVVDNFSDENVKAAIKTLVGIVPEHLQCVASSSNNGIYEITRKYLTRNLKEEFHSIEGLRYAGGDNIFIEVKYATLYL